MNLYQLKIPRRLRACLTCQNPFQPPCVLVSLLKGDEDNPEREDYCQDCFKALSKKEGSWGHWETKLSPKKITVSADQSWMDLFLEKVQNDAHKEALFLAQYLKRRAQLTLRHEIKKEGFIFYEDPKSSEIFALRTYHFSPGEAAELSGGLLREISSK